MFGKKAINSIGGYDESLPCFLDFELYVRAATKFKIANMDARLSLKRVHSKQFFHGRHGVRHIPEGRKARLLLNRRISEPCPDCPLLMSDFP